MPPPVDSLPTESHTPRPPPPTPTLNPGVRRREVLGWALYDFANSGYTTVVITAVFSAFFVGGVAQGASWTPWPGPSP